MKLLAPLDGRDAPDGGVLGGWVWGVYAGKSKGAAHTFNYDILDESLAGVSPRKSGQRHP